MIESRRTVLAACAPLLLSACINLEPLLPKSEAPVATSWPVPPASETLRNDGTPAAEIGWREFFTDPRLAEVITQALANNRDARVALLNVERARAQYRVTRADLWPSLNINAGATRSSTTPSVSPSYNASLGISAFEFDVFGRLQNLSQAALQTALAEEETQRSTQLSLVAEIANAWLTLAADRELLRIARTTLDNRQQALALSEKRHALGALSELDLAQAQTALETARNDVARYTGQVARDINALTLLAGASLDPALLPERFDLPVRSLPVLPAGLPSEILLRRPDILAVEHRLRGANANIGAARAAFFPSISLTASIGRASDELSSLFSGGTRAWTFAPEISLPIFQGGRLRANLAVSTADRDIALAQYEKAIQTGFREVADALVLTHSLGEQVAAQQALVAAAERAERLSRARYDLGRDSYLVLLDAERTLYAAQQLRINTQLAEYSNRVTLYKVLGGGWKEIRTPAGAE